MREERGKGEMGDRGKKDDKRREEGGEREGQGKEKGEEMSGGWSDSREHIRPSSSSQMVSLHTSHMQQ